MALTKAQRSERARNAVQTRWAKHGEEGKRKQRLTMLRAQADQLGYRLVPVDSNEQEH